MLEVYYYFKSPFVTPKLKFYFGKTKIGTPYFLPRKAIKDPQNPGRMKFVDKKIGFDFCKLGWKTKWRDNDIRFEWGPIFSFVFFGYQLAITLNVPEQDHYWESWIFYTLYTDKKLQVKDRVFQMIKEFPQNWTRTSDGQTQKIDMYQTTLKKKWRPKEVDEVRDEKLTKILGNI